MAGTEAESNEKQMMLDMKAISKISTEENLIPLRTEILYFAFLHMKKYPLETIEECIEVGVAEWIK